MSSTMMPARSIQTGVAYLVVLLVRDEVVNGADAPAVRVTLHLPGVGEHVQREQPVGRHLGVERLP
jgi:hypothetical protein